MKPIISISKHELFDKLFRARQMDIRYISTDESLHT